MSITLDRANRHIAHWSKELAPFPTRANWPTHLFHTCQLEVAVKIVKDGKISCRDDVEELICDVANQGALWNNPDAHKYVRLYFRPRNSFHLKTEGVKSDIDPYRVDPHMSMPVAFAFDLQKVITLPASGFVPGNFAKTGSAPLTGDAEFDNMEFDLVYHDGALPRDRMSEVHNWRMSEVVVLDELALSYLSFAVCRTPHEERTFRHFLGKRHLPKIIVEQKGSIFMRKGIFIDEIYWDSNILHMQFHGPAAFPKDKYAVSISCFDGGKTRRDGPFHLAPARYRFPSLTAPKDAVWRIEIEGCVVYHAPIPSLSGLVV
jgi:hypothetical protein